MRNDLIFQGLLRRRWFVNTVAVLVLLVPLPMWAGRHQDAQDRKGQDPVTVEATRVVEQGNDDLVDAEVEGELISFSYPGKVAVGDRVEVYHDGSQWHAMAQPPLWVPIAATALLWTASGVVLVFYPRMGRRRGWIEPKAADPHRPGFAEGTWPDPPRPG